MQQITFYVTVKTVKNKRILENI